MKRRVSPDINDVLYLALALKLNCPVWSNDRKLKNQNAVRIYSTQEIIRISQQRPESLK